MEHPIIKLKITTQHFQKSFLKGLAISSLVLISTSLLAGCATQLSNARHDFYQGKYDRAAEKISNLSDTDKDRVLFLMERGTIRQAAGDYEGSSGDFITAARDLKDLETYSISKGAASLVINDNAQDFKGVPFERTLLHDFTALNHLAIGNWENAAVESRKIIISLSEEVKDDYPDDAFSRYIAGLGLEMIDDPSNAALQYRLAANLVPGFEINEMGRIRIKNEPEQTGNNQQSKSPSEQWPAELVCVVLLGRSPSGREVWNETWRSNMALHAEISIDGQYMGRSYSLADTTWLAFTTMQKQALAKAVKTTSRIVMKEGIAIAVDQKYGEEWGDLVRLIFIALLEQPDVRRWETLPRLLQIARVPCPPDLTEFEVLIKNESGILIRKVRVNYPLTRNGNTFFSIFRDLPTLPTPNPISLEN